MRKEVKRGTLMPVKAGWLYCPTCQRPRKLLRILPDTRADRLVVYCRRCKRAYTVSISQGQCYESPS